MNKNHIVVGIASNTPDRAHRLSQAMEMLSAVFINVNVSPVYESPSVSGDGSIYANAVYSGMTTMTQNEVVAKLKELEREAGRTELSRMQKVVPLDLDLVIWNDVIVRPKDFARQYFNVGYRYLLANGAFQYSSLDMAGA